ncbi:MAG TPA: prolyl oligopeptidase family serine peptidase [Planctomycetota bacterium]|nr:prolyl oligopeptidase family serine peptidase [Planctomycetota bacterium]HRR81024.1 prolyl oligopeptidase family serine peptidase [Planctomycetota bacterium]HRT93624.1 prolyl oligopeptidase family serine peptidase [Planctomycetota bacterium]
MRLPAEGQPRRDCWLYVPKTYDRAKPYPLVVVLHPAGLHGSRFVSAWGLVAERTGAFLVAGPECKDQKKRLWDMADEKDLLATIRKVMATFHVDPSRVLLTGFSQGGTYSYTFGLRSPELFRAIAPVSGALVARPGPEADAILLKARGMGIYIAHGATDDRIPAERARASRARLEQAGFTVTYREVPQLGHFFPDGEPDRIWAWFAALTAPAAPVGQP